METHRNMFHKLGDWWSRLNGRSYGFHRLIGDWLPSRGNVLLVLVVAILIIATQSVWAQGGLLNPEASSTSTISYQGRLADSNGNPLTGLYNLEFRLYDVPSGGAPLWTEQWTGGNSVQVSDGLFNVMLGSLSPDLATSIEGHDELHLGITVGTDSEMVPRVQLGSVPFSMQAMTVPDGSITAAKLGGDVTANLPIEQDNILTNYRSVFGGTEVQVAAAGYKDVLNDTVSVSMPSTLRINFHGLVWKTGSAGRTALGIRLNGSPDTPPPNISDSSNVVQVGTPVSSGGWTLDSLFLSNTYYVDVDPGEYGVNLVLAAWEGGTSHVRAYAMTVEVLQQP